MIKVDLQSFRQIREGGNVTGVVFVELESGAFPETGWSDFPVIILGWWTDAFLQLEEPTTREVKWRFMDGPHELTLTKMAGVASKNAFEITQVRRFLLEAAEFVIAHCEQRKMLGKDLEMLQANAQRLKAHVFPSGLQQTNLLLTTSRTR